MNNVSWFVVADLTSGLHCASRSGDGGEVCIITVGIGRLGTHSHTRNGCVHGHRFRLYRSSQRVCHDYRHIGDRSQPLYISRNGNGPVQPPLLVRSRSRFGRFGWGYSLARCCCWYAIVQARSYSCCIRCHHWRDDHLYPRRRDHHDHCV